VASAAVPMIAALHKTEGGFRYVFMALAVLAAFIVAASAFFPSRSTFTTQKEKFAAQNA